MASSALYLPSIQVAGLHWAAAFGLYAVRYWPVLSRPRLDGKPAGAFDLQIVEQVPVAAHDLSVDAIVTETRVLGTAAP